MSRSRTKPIIKIPKPGIVTMARETLRRVLTNVNNNAWKRAFGMDGVSSQFGAEALSAWGEFVIGWTNDMVGPNGRDALNPNPYLSVFSGRHEVIPDGWILDNKSKAQYMSIIDDGEIGDKALRLSNPTTLPLAFTLTSAPVPVHKTWPYAAQTRQRHSSSMNTSQLYIVWYDKDLTRIGTSLQREYNSVIHPIDTWTDVYDSTQSGSPPPIGGWTRKPPAHSPNAAGVGDARFASVEMFITVDTASTADIDWGAITRTNDGFHVNATTPVSGKIPQTLPKNAFVGLRFSNKSGNYNYDTGANFNLTDLLDEAAHYIVPWAGILRVSGAWAGSTGASNTDRRILTIYTNTNDGVGFIERQRLWDFDIQGNIADRTFSGSAAFRVDAGEKVALYAFSTRNGGHPVSTSAAFTWFEGELQL